MTDRRAVENVLYILGAGFPAPLGLPVMSNFLAKAKDQFADDSQRFAHFGQIFEMIKVLGHLKNVFNMDLTNIEEILSILEVPAFLGGNNEAESFGRFLADVISYYTPSPKIELPRPSGRAQHTFGADGRVNGYAHFVAALFNLRIPILTDIHAEPTISVETDVQRRYAVVTPNYDRVLEMYAEFIATNFRIPCAFTPLTHAIPDGFNCPSPALAKLHGGVADETIVAPTWSKGSHPKIVPHWRLAEKLASQAHYIRIVGYSLAPADAYIRYLLKYAILQAPNLKRIDVMCLDDRKHTVRNNYREFLSRDFKGFRFRPINIDDYFVFLCNSAQPESGLQSDALENTHRHYFETRTKSQWTQALEAFPSLT